MPEGPSRRPLTPTAAPGYRPAPDVAERTREDDASAPLAPDAAPPAAKAHPPAVANVIALQAAAGNAAVRRMLSSGDAAQLARAGTAGGGAPLDERLRARFEPAYGTDFSSVRVHTGGDAAGSAQALEARAYTVGGD